MINKNSKTIVMVGGGIQQVEAARIIKDNGYNLLVTDKEAGAHCKEYADHFSEIDGKNVIEIATFINKVKKHFNIVGILTLTELVETVAKVARICKLPGLILKQHSIAKIKIFLANLEENKYSQGIN